ncbi:MAG: hypothetical protein IKW01_02085 [Firmicutes bacterium]|nr:hypothetical protein [Bacillota bacterium]
MTLVRTSEYGNIRLNENIFARIILDAIAQTDEKFMCSSEKGKILGGLDSRVSVGELLPHIVIKETETEYCLDFYIVMAFGTSIRNNCKVVLDYIEKEMHSMLPDKGGRILLKIVGVKSKRVAARSIEVVRKYEP